jgi:hypothetical protein
MQRVEEIAVNFQCGSFVKRLAEICLTVREKADNAHGRNVKGVMGIVK